MVAICKPSPSATGAHSQRENADANGFSTDSIGCLARFYHLVLLGKSCCDAPEYFGRWCKQVAGGFREVIHEFDREVLKPEENLAVQISKILEITGGNGLFRGKWQETQDLFDELESPYEFNLQQVEALREALEKREVAPVEARKLKDMPKGRHALKFTPDFFSTLLPGQQNARQVFEFLQKDAWLHDGDLDGASNRAERA